jgi:tetratricopeptide (TPR) repeat protein
MSTSSTWSESFVSQWRVIVGSVAIIAAITLVWALWSQKNNTTLSAGRDALFQASKTYQDELSSLAASLNPPAKAEDAKSANKKEKAAARTAESGVEAVFKKVNVAEKFSKSLVAFQKVAADFPKSRAAFDAQIQLGDLYMDHGQAADAVAWYRKAVDAAPTPRDRTLAQHSLGFAYEDSGKTAEALKAFESVSSAADIGVKADALLAQARIQATSGNKDQARQLYDRVIGDFKETEFERQAQALKGHL